MTNSDCNAASFVTSPLAGEVDLRRSFGADREGGHWCRPLLGYPPPQPSPAGGRERELRRDFLSCHRPERRCLRAVAAGRYGAGHRFQSRPAGAGAAFEQQGFRYLHVVDLDGAFAGKPVNAQAVDANLRAIKIPMQLGGGVRDMATVEGWLGKGVRRVIIGTAAVRDPAFVKEAARKYPATSRSASMPATAKWRWRAGRKPPSFPLWRSPDVSRTPALPQSSIPTLRATDCSRDSTSKPPLRWRTLCRSRSLPRADWVRSMT